MPKSKNITLLSHNVCTGCKMCGDICPKGSISFREDTEGFYYPVVNDNTCIDCGICSKKCPALNVSLEDKTDKAYSAYASDKIIKNSGSSGGIFSLLAINILNDCGVVYGASFDENLILRHTRVDSLAKLRPLCKSKYLQSDCAAIYTSVKLDLIAGKRVLFTGTPCQCQALKNYLTDKLLENLILVDFVCHGVPNQKMFDANLEWNRRKYGNIKSIEFRYKGKKVLHPQTLNMVYESNGKEKNCLRMHYQDPYYFGFKKHITLRMSCYQCKWARPERCSDITLADFWGIEKIDLGLNSMDGVSCLLLNTEKGHKLFSQIQRHLDGVHSIPINFAVENNSCLCSATQMPKNRESFFVDWNKLGYDAAVVKYLVPKRKWVFDLYYAIPVPIRKMVRQLMGNRMKYE